jgi:hypothetical protein
MGAVLAYALLGFIAFLAVMGLLGGGRKKRLVTSPTARPSVLQCEKCKAMYRPGIDAVSITANEMREMLWGRRGAQLGDSLPNIIMIGRAPNADPEQIRRDAMDILREGPKKGWTCKECHHDNKWAPITETPQSPPRKDAGPSFAEKHWPDITALHKMRKLCGLSELRLEGRTNKEVIALVNNSLDELTQSKKYKDTQGTERVLIERTLALIREHIKDFQSS